MSSSNFPVRRTSARARARLHGESLPSGSVHAAQYLTGTPETVLWGEVLLRAIDDFKIYTAHRSDPEANPVSQKTLRSILADGCDPEYWFFGNNTGFDAVCMVLDIEPDVIRRHAGSDRVAQTAGRLQEPQVEAVTLSATTTDDAPRPIRLRGAGGSVRS